MAHIKKILNKYSFFQKKKKDSLDSKLINWLNRIEDLGESPSFCS